MVEINSEEFNLKWKSFKKNSFVSEFFHFGEGVIENKFFLENILEVKERKFGGYFTFN